MIFIIDAYSQQVKVVYAKYTYIENGKSLKKDDTLSIHNQIVVKQDGEVHIINKTGWGFYLNEGTFDLDSCYQVYKNIYRDYDSVKVIVDTIFPNGVKGKFFSGCTAMSYGRNVQESNYSNGNMAFLYTEGNGLIKATTDTITIHWVDPKENSGRYIVEFQNIFDDLIGYRICNGNNLKVNINEFADKIYMISTLLVTVYSEDGRKSSRIAIQLKK